MHCICTLCGVGCVPMHPSLDGGKWEGGLVASSPGCNVRFLEVSRNGTAGSLNLDGL